MSMRMDKRMKGREIRDDKAEKRAEESRQFYAKEAAAPSTAPAPAPAIAASTCMGLLLTSLCSLRERRDTLISNCLGIFVCSCSSFSYCLCLPPPFPFSHTLRLSPQLARTFPAAPRSCPPAAVAPPLYARSCPLSPSCHFSSSCPPISYLSRFIPSLSARFSASARWAAARLSSSS